jgi:hypothetical protein
MQTKKILVTCLTVLFVGLALSVVSAPRANAFLIGGGAPQNTVSVTLGGALRGFTPASGGTVDAVQAGTTMPVTVTFQASNFNSPAYVRNVTVGFEGDWMTTYVNASILSLTTSQIGSVTISVTLPSAGGIKPVHGWTVQLWDGPASGLVSNCNNGNGEDNAAGSKSCFTISNGQAGYSSLAIYTADQFGAAQASKQAGIAIANIPSTTNQPAAAGQRAQALTEASQGDQSWLNGDYSGAKTHYQNALNNANAATATFTNLGGGSTNADIVNAILTGTGTALFGIGGLLAGIGGFFYLRRRPKA